MTNSDQDRVEAALRAAEGNDWAARLTLGDRMQRREAMSRALAAADALAPPALEVRRFAQEILHGDDEHRAWLIEAAEAFIAGQPMPPPRGGGKPAPPALDREAVADAIFCATDLTVDSARNAADAVLALLPAAPPPVPEDVRRLAERAGLAVERYGRWLDVLTWRPSRAHIEDCRNTLDAIAKRLTLLSTSTPPSAQPLVPEDVRKTYHELVEAEQSVFVQHVDHYRSVFKDAAGDWARQLLTTPAPEDADPNDCQPATFEGLLQAREELRSELKAEIANRIALACRIRELEEALHWALPFAEAWIVPNNVRLNPKEMRKNIDHVRALLGGSNVD